jgi:hypothetical protein
MAVHPSHRVDEEPGHDPQRDEFEPPGRTPVVAGAPLSATRTGRAAVGPWFDRHLDLRDPGRRMPTDVAKRSPTACSCRSKLGDVSAKNVSRPPMDSGGRLYQGWKTAGPGQSPVAKLGLSTHRFC